MSAFKIRMLEETLKNAADDLGPDKVAKLQAELAALKNGTPVVCSTGVVTEDGTKTMGATVVYGNAAKNTVVTPTVRRRRARVQRIVNAAVGAAFTAPVAQAPVVTVTTVPTLTVTPAAQAEIDKIAATLPAQPVVDVAVTTTDRVTFKKLRTGRWGLQGRNLVPGATVTVTKRDNSTTDVVVGKILWQGDNGNTLAYIKESD